MWQQPETARIARFLESIGLAVRPAEIPTPTFLPGLTFHNGAILVDESRLLYPGDLLHEAGHLAVMTPAERAATTGDIAPDLGYEIAVIAWSYAAALAMDLPPETVFHPHGYRGSSEAFLENFAAGRYVGVPMLQWLGLADSTFPAMRRWLRASTVEPVPPAATTAPSQSPATPPQSPTPAYTQSGPPATPSTS